MMTRQTTDIIIRYNIVLPFSIFKVNLLWNIVALMVIIFIDFMVYSWLSEMSLVLVDLLIFISRVMMILFLNDGFWKRELESPKRCQVLEYDLVGGLHSLLFFGESRKQKTIKLQPPP